MRGSTSAGARLVIEHIEHEHAQTQPDCAGFFLPAFASQYKRHLDKLTQLHEAGKLQVVIDRRRYTGIRSVPDAVAHLQSGASFGKVVVHIDSTGDAISKL